MQGITGVLHFDPGLSILAVRYSHDDVTNRRGSGTEDRTCERESRDLEVRAVKAQRPGVSCRNQQVGSVGRRPGCLRQVQERPA